MLVWTLTFVLLWAFYYLGNYAWLTLGTKLFLLAGFDLQKSLLIVSLNSLGFIAGSALAIWIGDKFERKHILILTCLAWAICLGFVGWWHSLTIIIIFGFLATTTISLFIPLAYTYTAEQFPTAFRATAVSISDGLGHIGGAFCGQIILGIYALFETSHHGVSAAFTGMLITGLITLLLLCFGQKVTGVSLRN